MCTSCLLNIRRFGFVQNRKHYFVTEMCVYFPSCCLVLFNLCTRCVCVMLLGRFEQSSTPVANVFTTAWRRQFSRVWLGRGRRHAPRLSPVCAASSGWTGHRHLGPYLRGGRGGWFVVRGHQPQDETTWHLSHRLRHRSQHTRRRCVWKICHKQMLHVNIFYNLLFSLLLPAEATAIVFTSKRYQHDKWWTAALSLTKFCMNVYLDNL